MGKPKPAEKPMSRKAGRAALRSLEDARDTRSDTDLGISADAALAAIGRGKGGAS